MSELRFDAYALDGEDATGEPHPLEIARDLIALGKPRSALEVLSLHHDQLVDDPEYLLICSEAWWATGDSLRAQQALLGAARLAPDDPVPMQLLAEVLKERGEHDKAERAQQKADSLHAASVRARESMPAEPPEVEDDLIAFAERQERSAHIGTSPKQLLTISLVVVVLAAIVAAIAWLAEPSSPDTAGATERSTNPRPAAPETPEPPAVPEAAAPAEPRPAEPTDEIPAELPPPTEPATGAAPSAKATQVTGPGPTEVEPPASPERKAPAAPKRIERAPSRRAKPVAKPKASATPPPASPGPAAPDADTVQAELASMTARELTTRADALFAEGHTGIAASYYRRALEIDPDYAPALVGIGRSILRAEKYDDAMRNATRALQLARGVDSRPGLEAEAIYQMGRVHLHRGELDAARRLFRQSISLSGTPSSAWFYLGEALWNDNSPSAREAYERYLELVSKGHLADRARRAIQ